MTQPDSQPEQLIRVVDALMEELARMATSDTTESEAFFSQLHDTVRTVLQPREVAVLAAGPGDQVLLVSRDPEGVAPLVAAWPDWLADESLKQGQVVTVVRNGTVLTAAPISMAGNFWGVVAVESAGGPWLDSLLSILAAVAEIAGEYLQAHEHRSQSLQGDWFQRFFAYSLTSHSSLETAEAATILANDARVLFGADRVQLFEVRGNRVKLLAISAVSIVQRRTQLLKASKGLASWIAQHGEAIVSGQPAENPRAENLIEDYQAEAGLEFFACFPLRAASGNNRGTNGSQGARSGRRGINGVLLVEYAARPSRIDLVHSAKAALPHAGLSLANARSYSNIPLRRSLSHLVRWFGPGTLMRWLLAGVVLSLVGLVLCFWKADFKLRISGELRPTVERIVFAPRDAFVERVFVRHGDQVTEGQLLAELSSPELLQEREATNGELAKLEDYQSSKQILLNQAATGNLGDATLQTRLASEIADLKFQIRTLSEKREFLNGQLAELQIHAPIAGTVVSWDVEQTLLKRPVRWGDPLLKLADESSPWELRLRAGENRVAYILESAESRESPLEVEYFLKSNPGRKFQTQILEIATATEDDPELGPSVAITCPVDDSQSERRHGAKIVGDVRCGQRSIGYLWTYEIVDTVKRQFVW